MINLLPDDTKTEFRAARMNVVLLRYNFFALGLALATLGLCLLFWIILSANQTNAVSENDNNNTVAQSYAKVRSDADDYSKNLKLADTILNNSVNYTSTLFAITKLLPEGVVLDGIELSGESFGAQTTFSAHAKSYDQATKLKENFQKSSILSNVYLQSITDGTQGADGSTVDSYPFGISISAKLNKVVE